MVTRKSKKDKGAGWLMRPVVADNLKRFMSQYFADKPEVTNRNLYLATKAELGLGTIQRTLSCASGASIDTLEAIARVFQISPYEFFIPSKTLRVLMDTSKSPANVTESADEVTGKGGKDRDATRLKKR